MAIKSSTFLRLERAFGDGKGFSVYEFHTVVNGNAYIAHHEEDKDRKWLCNVGKPFDCTHFKDWGNKEYKRLKSLGYKFAGEWEMDILGNKKRLS